MTKGLRVYPPAGYPYPGPQSNQPYQPGHRQPQPQYQQPYQPYPQGYPPPMPTPPWPYPPTGPHPQEPESKGMSKLVPIIIGIFGALVAVTAFFLLKGDSGGYFSNGETVTPTTDAHIVFVKKQHLDGKPPSSVRCSATTGAGKKLSLSVPSEVVQTTRGARPVTTYVSVAELPTDQGPLTVTCTNGRSSDRLDLVLGRPDSSNGVTIFFVGYGILMAVLIAVVIVKNRNYSRRQAQLREQQG